MENVWIVAVLWVGLALIATRLAIWLKISAALTEIVVGAVTGSVPLGATGGCRSSTLCWIVKNSTASISIP